MQTCLSLQLSILHSPHDFLGSQIKIKYIIRPCKCNNVEHVFIILYSILEWTFKSLFLVAQDEKLINFFSDAYDLVGDDNAKISAQKYYRL